MYVCNVGLFRGRYALGLIKLLDLKKHMMVFRNTQITLVQFGNLFMNRLALKNYICVHI